MDKLLDWGWDGLVLATLVLLILRAIPVAFDAWKTGNIIVGAVKTVGPIVTLAALLYGGYMVIREATGFIVVDAQNAPALQEAREWTGTAATSVGDGVSDLGSGVAGYIESFRDGLNSATADSTTGDGAPAESAPDAPATDDTVVTSNRGSSLTDVPAPQPTAVPYRPQAQGAPVQPTPVAQPTKVVGVHAGQMDTTNVLTPDEISSMAKRNAELGERARATAEATGNTGALNGNSEMLMFGNGGGGPTAAVAEQAITSAVGSTYTVKRGDDLNKIAIAVYGNKKGWVAICNANRDILRDCNNIRVGMVLTIPALSN